MTDHQQGTIDYLKKIIIGLEAETIEAQGLLLEFDIDNTASSLDFLEKIKHTGHATVTLRLLYKERAAAFREAVEDNLMPGIPRYLQSR